MPYDLVWLKMCEWSNPLLKIWKSRKLIVTLNYKVLFMQETKQPLDTLQDIKKMMERSSRFISLSGWSGISAGVCALVGAYFASKKLPARGGSGSEYDDLGLGGVQIVNDLIIIALIVFVAAFVSAFIFTYLRSKKNNTPIWDRVARRLMWNVLIPLGVGGLVILNVLQHGEFWLVGPFCLIFYGLALLNASKYTLGEIRYLAFAQLILGLISLWMPGNDLYFWALGFGVFHILYGFIMWWKYER